MRKALDWKRSGISKLDEEAVNWYFSSATQSLFFPSPAGHVSVCYYLAALAVVQLHSTDGWIAPCPLCGPSLEWQFNAILGSTFLLPVSTASSLPSWVGSVAVILQLIHP
jgi:hypothetical protein